MQQPTHSIQPTPVKYDPADFGAQMTRLFGSQYSWAILRHPRRDVAVIELGTNGSDDRNDATWRRIDARGVQYIKPTGAKRWQVWNGGDEPIDAYNAKQMSEQFALLHAARRDSPLSDSQGYLFQGRPLEPIFFFEPNRPKSKTQPFELDIAALS